MRRILHIEKDPRSSVELPRYQVTDKGRYGEESGWAIVSPPLNRRELADFLVQERVLYPEIERALAEFDQSDVIDLEAPPRYGPKIARTLFDTVCNPLIESLEYELVLIISKHWAFSFQSRTLELIKPYNHYIETRAWPNAEQLFERFGDLSSSGITHDEGVEKLQRAVGSLFDMLMASVAFDELCSSFFSQPNIERLGYQSIDDVFGAYSPSQYKGVVAQHIVNHSNELQSYYSSARFWNHYRSDFLALLSQPAIVDAYENACESSSQLLVLTERFRDRLKELRRDLSAHLDVPLVVTERHPASV